MKPMECDQGRGYFLPECAAHGCMGHFVNPLAEALSELADIVQGLLDEQNLAHIDSFTLQPTRAVLDQYKKARSASQQT